MTTLSIFRYARQLTASIGSIRECTEEQRYVIMLLWVLEIKDDL